MDPRGLQTTWLHALSAAALLLGIAPPGAAQAGDKKGEEQPMVDRNFAVPPAPARTPADEQRTFALPEGYQITCVASEPLVRDPVEIRFDAEGRLWVVEMTTLMLDPDGSGETEPGCAIAVLTDTDDDGIYDTRREFARDLILPRSICFVGSDGVLAILPPEIVHLRDTDGDGVADERTVIDRGIRAGLDNPEHAANSLRYGIDNWIHLANHGKRYRFQDGTWRSEPSPQLGQWGLGQDAWGRFVYNYNSSVLHGDLVPGHYLVRNSALGRAQGVNAKWGQSTRVWPSRVNTGVNRGYQKNTLADDGRLARYTAACGPAIFTGTQLAPADQGDAFVCEPAGNLVRQLRLRESDGRVQGENPYEADRGEFLTSTDERFRPVNLSNGPDGALYIVDLYRGILQHRVFMTSFLRRQIEERGLATPTGWGRIWRVTHESATAGEPAGPLSLANASDLALVEHFFAPNGWNRLTAQQILVERARTATDRSALLARLAKVAADRAQPLAQTHALWTLEGLDAIDPQRLLDLIGDDPHPRVLVQLIRLSERFSQELAVLQCWQSLIAHDSPEVRWQLAHSLGTTRHPMAQGQMIQLLVRHPEDAILRTGVISGLAEQEEDMLDRVLAHPVVRRDPARVAPVVRDLAQCVVRRAEPAAIRRTAERALRAAPPLQAALVDGLAAGAPRNPGDGRYRFAEAEPAALPALADQLEGQPAARLSHLRARLSWSAEPVEIQRSPEHRAAIARGAEVYAFSCGACHQSDGAGLAGLAPPLAGSEWLSLPDERLAEIALFGLSGPIEVAGESWDLVMPGWAHLSDQELADVLSYVTAEFGGEARFVPPATIDAARR